MAEYLISNAAGRFYFISRRLFICGYKESLISMRMKINHYDFGVTINSHLASTTDTLHCTTYEVYPACNWCNKRVNTVLISAMLPSAWKMTMIGNSFNTKIYIDFFNIFLRRREATRCSILRDTTLLTLVVSDEVF